MTQRSKHPQIDFAKQFVWFWDISVLIFIMLGFSLCLFFLPLSCSMLLAGWVEFPGFPPESSLKWRRCAPAGHTLSLSITHLDLEDSPDCENDALEIFTRGSQLSSLCGHKSFKELQSSVNPSLISSPGGCLSLSFHADYSNVEKHPSFRAYYTLQDIDECAGPNNNCSHICNNYIGGYSCACPPGYDLNSDQHTCNAVDCGDPDLPEVVALLHPNPGTLYQHQIQLKCESKYYKLSLSENYTCGANRVWRSAVNVQTKWPKCVPVCGLSDNVISSSGKILGGKAAKDGQIPWQLLKNGPNQGGASLINDRWAVTAAHVVDGQENETLTFHGGTVYRMGGNPVVMHTEKILIHPQYQKGIADEDRTNFDNDIALIKMNSIVKLGPNICPICLPKNATGDAMEGKVGTISGFGLREGALSSPMLHHAPLEEYPEADCSNPALNTHKELVVTKNMFCAGRDGIDSCQGDSGGPLFIPMLGFGNAQNPYLLKGIVSWGRGCNNMGYYTKVQNYLDWIRETIEKDEQEA